MSSILILQLSDMHIKTQDDPIVDRWASLLRSIELEIMNLDKAIVITFCGDAAFSGQTDQFEVAGILLDDLFNYLKKVRSDLDVHLINVPGNHDCNLTSEDEEARLSLRHTFTNKKPPNSIIRILLRPQEEYFKFSKLISSNISNFTFDNPFYNSYDICVDEKYIRFHLINSSWTSVLKENDDLRFPLEEFKPSSNPEAFLSITLSHHPIHWFMMPDVRRELRDLIDQHSDLVLTGHEHENEASRRTIFAGGDINYIEGGVLQDDNDMANCTFNIIRINLSDKTQEKKTMTWNKDHFAASSDSSEPVKIYNPNRIDRRFQFKPKFERWLDEIEDPITHPRVSQLQLSHIFSYPDLRKILQSESNKDDEVVERVRSENVFNEMKDQNKAFIIGYDRSGKSSLCKRLMSDFRSIGNLPLLLDGERIPRKCDKQRLRNLLDKILKEEYQRLTYPEFEQLDKVNRILIIDNMHDGPSDSAERYNFLNIVPEIFEQVFLVAGDDFYFELINQQGNDVDLFFSYQRYEICDFGHQRLESLTSKWMTLGLKKPNPVAIREKAIEICQKVQSVLELAGLPHTPWLLIVVLSETEQTDTPFIAAQNGNYGHLYQAVITVALSQSKMKHFDLSGRFIYLGEFAHLLHKMNQSTISEFEAREFHKSHCDRYGLPFDYEKVRDDLLLTRMIRKDGDEIAFRSKWVYCFFVAWWLNRNLNIQEAKDAVESMTKHLYHETSANILVFLAHFSNDPIVINSMRETAASLYNSSPKAEMTNDISDINKLNKVSSLFRLPNTNPEINRKVIIDAKDDQMAKRTRRSYDGRNIETTPNNEASIKDNLMELRASLKTIRILGQVLRNGATSIEEKEKKAILMEILTLGRRILGNMYVSGDE
ncbi:MAG: hypothetical protein GF364_11065, partial [Candidatus Lokiarchaeota archaeon]|nr:hypothetical protein [Candidatus Lokiarchaeota archaeon]